MNIEDTVSPPTNSGEIATAHRAPGPGDYYRLVPAVSQTNINERQYQALGGNAKTSLFPPGTKAEIESLVRVLNAADLTGCLQASLAIAQEAPQSLQTENYRLVPAASGRGQHEIVQGAQSEPCNWRGTREDLTGLVQAMNIAYVDGYTRTVAEVAAARAGFAPTIWDCGNVNLQP